MNYTNEKLIANLVFGTSIKTKLENMTFDEKIDCFSNWLKYNKEKHGDNFYYIPKM